MIKKTRIKIIVVTMLILVVVFAAIGIVTYILMTNRPPRYPHEVLQAQIPMPESEKVETAVNEIEKQLTREWLMWYSIFASTALTVLFIITYFLSGWIVSPIKETIIKQKQFVSDASHELKTPISIILANADAMKENDEAQSKWLKNIKAQAERIRLLTNDLLVLTKIDENSSVKTEKLNLSEAIMQAVLPFESIIFEAGKTLETAISKNICHSCAKEDIIKLIDILMDNAIKYSDVGGTITVSLSKQSSRPVITIHNTGSFIKEYEKERIFDRFYRSDYSRTRETGGNGLGLSILYTLAQKRGWKITVNSNEKNFTAFTIYL